MRRARPRKKAACRVQPRLKQKRSREIGRLMVCYPPNAPDLGEDTSEPGYIGVGDHYTGDGGSG
jgi:hypothetical protein